MHISFPSLCMRLRKRVTHNNLVAWVASLLIPQSDKKNCVGLWEEQHQIKGGGWVRDVVLKNMWCFLPLQREREWERWLLYCPHFFSSLFIKLRPWMVIFLFFISGLLLIVCRVRDIRTASNHILWQYYHISMFVYYLGDFRIWIGFWMGYGCCIQASSSSDNLVMFGKVFHARATEKDELVSPYLAEEKRISHWLLVLSLVFGDMHQECIMETWSVITRNIFF